MCCILTVFKITVNLGALTYRAVCHRPDLSCLWKLMGDSCTIIHPLPAKSFRSVPSVIKWCWFQKYMYCIYAKYHHIHVVCSVQVKIIEFVLFCSFVVPENLYRSKDSEHSCELNLQQTLQLGAR